MKFIDLFLDRITMYRLLLYYLIVLLCMAMLLGAMGAISYSPYSIALSSGLIVFTCWIVNRIFAWAYNAPSNPESSILTGLILALIITPLSSVHGVSFLLAASGLAIASKYILAIKNKHIFNPVAIAVVLTALGPQESASWWVGSALLLPYVILGGLLVVRKLRHFKMVGLFIFVSLLMTVLMSLISGRDIATNLQSTILHSSLFFLAFVMLTEPATSPTIKSKRLWYALIVGLLFVPGLHIGSLYSTPELALVIGNLAAFFMSTKIKTLIKLKASYLYGKNTEDIVLKPERKFAYEAGQYIEMTLPHVDADSRGSRRYFTLASSPTEEDLRIGVRYYEKGSSFKEVLRASGADMFASIGQLGGGFTLPEDSTRKLTFIAGGIGITPFRGMIKFLTDTNDRRDVTLLYGERSVSDITYGDVLELARQKIGTKTIYVIDNPETSNNVNFRSARIDAELVQKELPDYLERLFYISGPQMMVRSIKKMLIKLGVNRKNIKTDYFSGYA